MAGSFVNSIVAVGDGKYAVTFSTAEGSRREYMFAVHGPAIPVVVSPDDFTHVQRHNQMNVRAMYGAVLAMHKACTTEVDLDVPTGWD